MGNKKNTTNQHQNRGKFKHRISPNRQPKKHEDKETVQPNRENVSPLEGSRVINLDYLASFVNNVSAHSQSCKEGTISLTGESYRNGLASILSARCSGCRMEMAFPTSSRLGSQGCGRRWECNLAAVWGQVVTGGGHSSLNESLSVLGVPTMGKKAFMATEKALDRCWWEILEQSMKEAAEEEKRLAIEKGSFHEGVPAIDVVLDGGWCKRTHKHSYNAKSGVAIIIGLETGKLLHIGVRNKYCSVCEIAEKQGKEPQNHDCHKNWEGASSSMETDIILEGFKNAERKYGLRYIRFVGDGDSSVHPTLIAEVPVWGHAIRKVECANHATKCYRAALEKLVAEKPKYKGRGKLTEGMRKRLTGAARSAIKMRSSICDKKLAAELLRQDLYNGPLHCFGIHTNCSPDYCRGVQATNGSTNTDTHTENPAHTSSPQSDETTIITVADNEKQVWDDVMEETDVDALGSAPAQPSVEVDPEMLSDIQRLVGRLIGKAEQLLGMETKQSTVYILISQYYIM